MHQIRNLNSEEKNWIEINDQSRGVCNVNSDIRFKTTTLKSGLCGYSNPYILVKGRITITGVGSDAAAIKADERDKGVIFKIMLYLLIVKGK